MSEARAAGLAVGLALLLWAAPARAQGTCEADPAAGLPPQEDSTPRWYDACTAPADQLIEAVPDMIGAVLTECLPATTLSGLELAGQQKVRELRDKIATVCMAFGPGAIPCAAALVTGTLTIEVAECAVKGLVKGAPLSPENKKVAEAGVEAFFDLKGRRAFVLESKNFVRRYDSMLPEDRDSYFRGLGKEWNELMALKWTEAVPVFVEALSGGDGTTRRALARVDRALTTCDLKGAASELATAVESGKKQVTEARRAVVDGRRAMGCIEKMWSKQLGPGWRQRVAIGDGGPHAPREYEKFRTQVERLQAEEPERLGLLAQAGALCSRLDQQQKLVSRTKERYERMKGDARTKLLAKGCDFAGVEEAIRSMEKLEQGDCAEAVTSLPADFAAKGAPYYSSVLKAELKRRKAECEEAAVETVEAKAAPDSSHPAIVIPNAQIVPLGTKGNVDGWTPFRFSVAIPPAAKIKGVRFYATVTTIGQLIDTDTLHCLDGDEKWYTVWDRFESLDVGKMQDFTADVGDVAKLEKPLRAGQLRCAIQDDTAVHEVKLEVSFTR